MFIVIFPGLFLQQKYPQKTNYLSLGLYVFLNTYVKIYNLNLISQHSKYNCPMEISAQYLIKNKLEIL